MFASPDVPPPRAQFDPDVAQGISIAVTVIAPVTFAALGASTKSAPLVGLGAVALLVGPSTGRWYAGESAVPSMLLRLTGMVITVGAFAALVDSEAPECDGTGAQCAIDTDRYDRDQTILEVAFFGGAALVVGTAIWDCARARSDANDANATKLQLVPVVSLHGAGVALSGSF